jgi:hypothetical protein
MSIKEFSHKHSLKLFWSTVILLIILIIIGISDGRYDRGYGPRGIMRGVYNDNSSYGRGDNIMRGGYQRNIDKDEYEVEDINATNTVPVQAPINQ